MFFKSTFKIFFSTVRKFSFFLDFFFFFLFLFIIHHLRNFFDIESKIKQNLVPNYFKIRFNVFFAVHWKSHHYSNFSRWGSPHCIVANVLDCDSIVSKFKHQSHCYIYFQTTTLGKGINQPYPHQQWIK